MSTKSSHPTRCKWQESGMLRELCRSRECYLSILILNLRTRERFISCELEVQFSLFFQPLAY
jgi:hypothetical protein